LAAILLTASMSAAQTPRSTTALHYPTPHAAPQVDDYFGTKVSDPHRWMEDLDSPETKAWVDAENEVPAAYFKPLTFRDSIHKRMMDLANYERFSMPQKRGSRYFYSRNSGLQNQAVVYWTEGLTGEPRELIDP